jgi:hypothetical protein
MNFDDDNYGMLQSLISPVISLPELLSENELIKFNCKAISEAVSHGGNRTGI